MCGCIVSRPTEDDAVDVEHDTSDIRVAFGDEHIEAERSRHSAHTEADHSQTVNQYSLTPLTQLHTQTHTQRTTVQ